MRPLNHQGRRRLNPSLLVSPTMFFSLSPPIPPDSLLLCHSLFLSLSLSLSLFLSLTLSVSHSLSLSLSLSVVLLDSEQTERGRGLCTLTLLFSPEERQPKTA